MKCQRCGRELTGGAKVCLSCSTQIGEPDAIHGESSEHEPDLREIAAVLSRELAGIYELEGPLGGGGMAVVFKATEVDLLRRVALKVLRPQLLLTRSAAERFKQEARIAAGMDHPNIIPIYRVGQAGELFFIAMKFIEGRSLHSIVESQGALPVTVVLHILREALNALTHAHEHGIVHRDIKGGNILVDGAGRVTVADFGIARPIEDTGLTATGAIIGTPSFMSPEQWSGGRLTAQSDQYSLGVLAFQLLTGSEPFESDTVARAMQHHLFTPVPNIRSVRKDVPAALVSLVSRALSKDSADRFPSSRAMLEAVEAIPVTDADHRESTDILRQLAQGSEIPRIKAGALPATPDLHSHITGINRTNRRNRRSAIAATAVAVVAATAMWFLPDRTRAADPAPLVRDTLARPTATAAATPAPDKSVRASASKPKPMQAKPVADRPTAAPAVAESGVGKLRLRAIPAIAEIQLEGKVAGLGSLWDYEVSAGTRHLTVQAPGYQSLDTTIAVHPGETTQLRISLKARDQSP